MDSLRVRLASRAAMRAWPALAILLLSVAPVAFGGPGVTGFGDMDLLRQGVSKEARRFRYVGEQGYDTSCGYAAAASLLSLYWQVPIDEADLISLNGERTTTSGVYTVNLADIARAVQKLDFEVQGGQTGWDGLVLATERYAPVLVHYAQPETHFALVLAVGADSLVSADPARGLELVSRSQFEKRWSGVILLVKADQRQKDEGRLQAAIVETRKRESLLARMGGARTF